MRRVRKEIKREVRTEGKEREDILPNPISHSLNPLPPFPIPQPALLIQP
jgi:hypothetical protein